MVLSPLQELWHHLNKFNRTHLAALAPEGEVAVLNWYHRFARHPFYGQLGLNSGVMLMDLKKLRELKFTKKIIEIYREYKQNIVWGDQDLLNIYFNKYPGRYLCSFDHVFLGFHLTLWGPKNWSNLYPVLGISSSRTRS